MSCPCHLDLHHGVLFFLPPQENFELIFDLDLYHGVPFSLAPQENFELISDLDLYHGVLFFLAPQENFELISDAAPLEESQSYAHEYFERYAHYALSVARNMKDCDATISQTQECIRQHQNALADNTPVGPFQTPSSPYSLLNRPCMDVPPKPLS